VTLEHVLQAIMRLDPLLHQSFAVGDQGAYLAHRYRGNPDCWDEMGCEQTGKLDRITRIGLDSCGADQLHGKADEPR
jgi:hypothetical protein